MCFELPENVPTCLYVRVSRNNPQTYEVVTELGEVLAAEVPDLNCAEVFAASPVLMEAIYIARRELERCVEEEGVSPEALERLMDCHVETRTPPKPWSGCRQSPEKSGALQSGRVS